MIDDILWLCIFHCIFVLNDSVWLITLIPNQCYHYVFDVTTLFQLVVPLINIIKTTLLAEVKYEKCSNRTLEEQVGDCLKLFLTKSIPDMQVCHFVCFRDLECFMRNFYVCWSLLLWKCFKKKPFADTSFAYFTITNENDLIVKMDLLLSTSVFLPRIFFLIWVIILLALALFILFHILLL